MVCEHRALVFNCHFNGLSIIQELGRHGVNVLALDSTRSVGTYSRYAEFHQCPDPLTAERDFIEYLLALGPEFREKPVLFPTNDQWVVAVSRHKEALSRYYLPCVADWPTAELLIRKRRFYEWGIARGYPVPRVWTPDQFDLIPVDAFPLAAKPQFRRIASNDERNHRLSQHLDEVRLTVLRDKDELDRFVASHADILEYLVFVDYVEGLSDRMYTVGVYADREHQVLGLFTGRKVRGYPPDIGDCIVGQVEEIPEEIPSMVKLMCRELEYHGIAEFEFKRDATTGVFKLIEVNPRSWSWVGITPACGVSLPWLAYADLSGGEQIVYTDSLLPTGSVKWVKILSDLENCLYFNRRAGYPDWHMTPMEWWQSLRAEHRVIAEFAADDPMPGIYSVYANLRGLATSALKQIL